MTCPLNSKNNLKFISIKRYDQTLSLKWIGNNPDKIASIKPDNVRKYYTGELKGISKLTSFIDDVDGENTKQYIKRFFRYRSGDAWSNHKPIEEINSIEVDYRLPFELELTYYYSYDIDPSKYNLTNMYINEIVIDGEYTLTIVDSEALVDAENPEVILRPKDIYKVFRLDGFEITKQDTGNVEYEIFYRFTQNGGRTFTPFEPLTQDNIKTLKLDELRFAQVEYLVKFNCTSGALIVYDIMLLGDFQNVTANYLKTNRYGLKQDCLSFMLNNGASNDLISQFASGDKWTNSDSTNAFPGDPTNTIEYPDGSTNNPFEPVGYEGLNINSIETNGLSCYLSATNDIINQGTNGVGGYWGVGGPGDGSLTGAFGGGSTGDQEYWNPYESDKIVAWQNLLANQMNSIFGWKVNYFITDPDGNGIDRYMHEYQLKHVVKVNQLKIIVPENNFPDETLKLNFFNLDLFDTLEINIMKDEFKRAFGIEKRPSQDDIIHICTTNKLYYIKHSQALRDVMNASIYYKIVLEKYEQRADININDEESKNILEQLTNNTTLDEILGIEKKQEENKVANKKQTYSLAYDRLRHKIYSGIKIEKYPLYNDNIKFASTYYDLSDRANKIAIDYTNIDQKLEKGNNRTFINWFNAKSSYDPDKHLSRETFNGYNIRQGNYNLLSNYDENNRLGYRWFFEPEHIFFEINDQIFDLPYEILTDIWYGLMISLNQRQHKLTVELYRRKLDISIIMFNKNTYEKIELITDNDIYDAYDPDNTGYTYENAINDGFLPVKNTETNYYAKESIEYNDFTKISSLEFNISPYEFEHNETMKLYGSKIKYTNLRIFDNIIADDSKNNILNEAIINDEHHLIIYDNANREIKATTYWNKRFE